MHIAVFGTGGVGGYFGGRLAKAGDDVTFIARGVHMKAMQANGLRVDSVNGDFTLNKVQVTDDPRKIAGVDAILVAVKAWQVPEVAQKMRPMVDENTIVVPLCNGVDAPAQLKVGLGAGQVLGGFCRISAHIAAPGHIRHVGVVPYAAFGDLGGDQNDRAVELLNAFQRAGVDAEIPPDIRAGMWGKFLFISAISGVGSVTRAPVGVVRKISQSRQLLATALREVHAVSRTKEIRLPDDIIDSTVEFVDNLAHDVVPSMQRDIMAGKPSELEAQTGAVVRFGKETGVPTPVNEFIYNSLLPQELTARGQLGM